MKKLLPLALLFQLWANCGVALPTPRIFGDVNRRFVRVDATNYFALIEGDEILGANSTTEGAWTALIKNGPQVLQMPQWGFREVIWTAPSAEVLKEITEAYRDGFGQLFFMDRQGGIYLASKDGLEKISHSPGIHSGTMEIVGFDVDSDPRETVKWVSDYSKRAPQPGDFEAAHSLEGVSPWNEHGVHQVRPMRAHLRVIQASPHEPDQFCVMLFTLADTFHRPGGPLSVPHWDCPAGLYSLSPGKASPQVRQEYLIPGETLRWLGRE